LTEYMIVETYANTLYEGHRCHRYWVPGGFFIMVGGSLLGPEDWEHLRSEYGITHVINVETEHDDAGKVPPERLCQARVPDDGTPFPAAKVLAACLFAAEKVANAPAGEDPRFYVHCQMGGSRSPAFAYALMRAVFEMSAEGALAAIRGTHKSDYGHHDFHKSYIASVEAALAPVFGGG